MNKKCTWCLPKGHPDFGFPLVWQHLCPKCDGTGFMKKTAQVNLNDHIYFEINECGRKIWDKHWSKYNIDAPDYPTKLQLWDFMNIFGQHMGLGLNSPIKTDVRIEIKE